MRNKKEKMGIMILGLLFLPLVFSMLQTHSLFGEWEYTVFAQNESPDGVEHDSVRVAPEYKDLMKENITLKSEYAELQKIYAAVQESEEYVTQSSNMTQLVTENQSLKTQFDELVDKYENLEKDRNNILIQTKRLLEEKREVRDLEAELASFRQTNESLLSAQEDDHMQDLKWQDEIKELERAQAELTKERDYYQESLDKVKKGTAIKELKAKLKTLEKESRKTISSLEKEKKNLFKDFKQTKSEYHKVLTAKTDAELAVEDLKEKLDDAYSRLEDAVNKNIALEKHIEKIPEKFTEIARQNQTLVKDTSEMHYNLGVFYTKNREYKRAIKEFEQTIDIMPDDGHAHFNLGYIYAEYLVNRPQAIKHFRQYLRLAKSGDDDADWVKKYLLMWETYEGIPASK